MLTAEMPADLTLLLNRSDVKRLLTPDECIAAVEDAFCQHARGETQPLGILGMHAQNGSFHIKAFIFPSTRNFSWRSLCATNSHLCSIARTF